MKSNFSIPENCQTCPHIFVGTCGNCKEMQEKVESKEFGNPFDRPDCFNPQNIKERNIIPLTYDYQEGN
jgi:hypothetical protein